MPTTRLFILSALAIASSLVGAGPARAAAEFATVVSSTPVTATVAVPRQVCSEGQQIVQQRPSGAGAVIGAIAGGVIGHQVGGGFGRAAASGIGAVAGAVIGDQVEAANSPVAVVPDRRCQLVNAYETRVVGYDVMYDHAGQRYSARMARDPGQQVAVSVQPAEGSGLPAPVDPGREGTPVPAYGAAAPPPAPAAYYEPIPQQVVVPNYYYVAPPSVYVAPMIGFGIGYYGGYRRGYYGGYRGRHWR